MRRLIWHRIAFVLAAGSVFLAPPAASAASPATTGGVTAITTTSGTLHGVADPTSSDSAWFFEYGTTASLGQHTAPQAIGTGSQNVSKTISSLQPGTTYYYRLVVQQSVGYSPTSSHGDTLSFTTSSPSGSNTVATTGDATSITATSATLNGVANPESADSVWMFQYGKTVAYGKVTQPRPVGLGVTAVSATIVGLTPGTTYHFRLDVAEGSYPSILKDGLDRSFTTKSSSGKPPNKFGKASLRSHRLTVHHRIVSIRFSCSGAPGASCKGRVSISARGKFGKRLRTVNCGRAKLSISAGKSKTLKARVSRACATLLHKAKHHKHGAKLKAGFSTHQSRLKTRVTLIRR
jgi:hypothetical protein